MPGIPLFVSYSHKDQEWLDDMSDHLAPLENEKLVEVWDDRDLRAGSDLSWEDQLLPKLDKAGVIVLLLSPAFAASRYCQEVELPRALARKKKKEALVFLLHLKTYAIEANLREFQILPSEKISIEDSASRGIAFRDIVVKIREELASFKPAYSAAAPRASSKTLPSYLPYLCNRSDQEGDLYNLRERHESFSQRPIVYLVSGPESESHEAFHERIARDIFPRLISIANASTIDPIPLEWPGRAQPGPEAAAAFARRVASKLESIPSKPAEVAQVMPQGITHLVTTVSGDSWDQKQQELLRSFLAYLSEWPDLPGDRALCVGISIAWEKTGPLEKELEASFPSASYPKLHFEVLPDLDSPEEVDAKEWLILPKVKKWYDADTYRDELRDRLRQETFAGQKSIPMNRLAPPLLALLKSVL